MPKIQIVHDDSPKVKDQGHMYMNCTRCLREMPKGTSPKEWARQQTAITEDGSIQVWCTRHNINIDLMKIEVK